MDMHPWDPTAPFLQSNDNSEQVRQHGDYVIVGLHTDPEVNRWERRRSQKGWLAIAKLKPHSLFISLLSMLKKAFYNVKIEK